MLSCIEYGASCLFFFQAEDGIRDIGVTGVQTCALPISGVDLLARVTVLGEGVRGSLTKKLIQRLGLRSEERRVGKECRSGWSPYQEKKKRHRRVRSTIALTNEAP